MVSVVPPPIVVFVCPTGLNVQLFFFWAAVCRWKTGEVEEEEDEGEENLLKFIFLSYESDTNKKHCVLPAGD